VPGGFEGAGSTASAAASSVPGWNGLASFTFRARCGTYRDAAETVAVACAQAAGAIARYGDALGEGRDTVRKLQREGEQCVERIRTAERTAAEASDREAAAHHMAYQASFLSGADAGAMRAAFENQAADAAADRERAHRAEQQARDELDQLRREAERERNRVKEAGRRAAAEVSGMAVEMPVVAYPGAPASAVTDSGPRPDTGGGAAQFAKDAAGELSGVNDAKRGIEQLGDGNIIGGGFSLAMAWPGAKAIKGIKELGEEAVEQVGKKGSERVARETLPAFKGTPAEHLPVWREGDKARGVLDIDGRHVELKSGYDGPSATRPNGTTPGSHNGVRAHVEPHVAALFRNENLTEATLYINKDPCLGPPNLKNGCEYMLKHMLPEGSKLTLHAPDGTVRTYTGIADPKP
jgi:SCP1.201-like deaminase